MKTLSAWGAISLLALAAPASAATVYNNGAANGAGGNETTAWVQSESFTFGSATTVAGAGVYLGGFGGIAAYDNGFQYYLFSDAGGNPGAILQSGSVTPTITNAGTPWFGNDVAYLFAFDFASAFNAAGGTVYHLGIHASGTGDFNRDEIYWASAAANATPTGIESAGGTFNNWSGNGVEHAFYLTDVAIGGAVPEPATWGMMLVGFGIVGGAMRRRQRTSLSFG